MEAKSLRTQLLLPMDWVVWGQDISAAALEEQRRKKAFVLVGRNEWGHAPEMPRYFIIFELRQS